MTEDGEVYSWGRNEQAQLGDTSSIARAEPTAIAAIGSKEITGVSCGPAQVGEAVTCKSSESREPTNKSVQIVVDLVVKSRNKQHH